MKITTIDGKSYELPNWVNWLAQDESGVWYGYKIKPEAHVTCWLQDMASVMITRVHPPTPKDKEEQAPVPEPNPNWKQTLQSV